MRVPVSWLREYAPIPEPYDALEVGRRLTQAGLEVEAVEQAGHDVLGVITGQVMAIEELTGFKKPIRYCRVAVRLGIERSLMIAHGLTEIRDAVDGDVRFSRAFGMEI